ncbi:MAG: glycosidase [Candidatus Bathyarchaeota archaeon]|nr:glycosidase [Candidatus Bathyarchaeota archaeon]
MVRFEGNPILEPIEDHPWESRYVFNTAMIGLGGRIHYFYRAMGEDKVSRIGYASSEDGYHIDLRLPNPVFEPSCSLEKYGCEDPRLTLIGDRYVMTYTAYGDIFQVGITSISSADILEMNWAWGERWFPFPNTWNKNAVVFPRMIGGRYVMLHRHEPDICIAHSGDLCSWNHTDIMMRPRQGRWDSAKIGAAGPPMELEDGWLLVYHGVDDDRTYRLGAAILDKDDPGKVRGRTDEPILEPREEYERFGQVPNVVFSCGSVIVDEELLISYGAADTVIGVASFSLDEILEFCV